jgi:hypothetical protein
MNLIELILFLLPLFLCFFLGRFLYSYIGWYGGGLASLLGAAWIAFPFVDKKIATFFRRKPGHTA